MATHLIPAQITGTEFLRASHFRVSNDDRTIDNAMKTTFHRDFPPPPTKKTPAALPPKPADFMHRDCEKINVRNSETTKSFPEKRAVLDDLPDKYTALYKTHFKMNSDERIDSFQTSHNHYFKPKDLVSAVDNSHLSKNLRVSHFPQGDKEKAEDPISVYKYSFPQHNYFAPDRKTETHRFWKSDTIRGDKERRFNTTHNATFTGVPTKPATPVEANRSTSIPNGDPEKIFEESSTASHSYQPNLGDFRPVTGTDPYTKLYKTTFTLKDGLGAFDKYMSTAKDAYKPQALYGTAVQHDQHRNASDVPEGDMDVHRSQKRVNYTTTRHHHKPLDVGKNRLPLINGSKLRTASNVQLGRNELASRYYNTTFDDTYKPLYLPYSKADSYPKSVVPLKYYEEVPENAATAEDYRAYDVSVHGAKHVEPYLLQQSHFDAPLGEKRYFSTTQSEHYTPKQIKRIQIDPNSLQLSTLPIGTMGRYIKGSNVGW